MLMNRVVPVLLLHDGLLVKTEKFKKPRYVGDPVNAVRIFNEKEVDELVVLDMDPCRAGAPIRMALLEEIASEAFMPVAYGGGVDSLDKAPGAGRPRNREGRRQQRLGHHAGPGAGAVRNPGFAGGRGRRRRRAQDGEPRWRSRMAVGVRAA